jgi:CO/xanthine dehydrogenase Mo-binding subunit
MPDTTGANGLRENFRVVGMPNIPGLTSYAMATGVAKYGADFTYPGMLHAKILRSPYAHARIRSIDTKDALAVPGVLDVVLWNDPIFNEIEQDPTANGPRPAFLMNEAYSEGDEVGAVVIAESESLCEEGLHALRIDWEILPCIIDLQKGLDPSIPKIRGPEWDKFEAEYYKPIPSWVTREGDRLMTRYYPEDPPRQGNISYSNKIDGNPEEGWKQADFTLEYDVNVNDSISTIPNPPASVAYWNDEMYIHGKVIHIEGAVQRRQAIMAMYRLPGENVVQEGLFQGGKYCDWGMRMSQIITPLLSKRMGGRPVRCCNTREENFSLNRHEAHMHLRLGVTNEGLITVVEDNVLKDNGAPNTSQLGTVGDRDWGPYYTLKCKNISQLFTLVDSNRGYMHCSAQFFPFNWDTITIGIYLIAEKLGKDPVDIARLNLHGPSSQDDPNPVPSFERCVKAGKELMNWNWHSAGTRRLPDGRLHGASFRYGMCPRHGFLEYYCRLEYRDGAIHFPTQGPIVGFFGTECYTMIIAEELGVNFEDISVEYDYREKHSDQACGSDGVTGQGWIVKECANILKQKILESTARQAQRGEIINYGPFTRYHGISPLKGCTPEELDIADGKVIVKADPSRCLPLSQATAEDLTAEYGGFSPDAAWSTGFGRILDTMETAWCEVAVDEETGEVEVLKYLVIPDVGKVIRRTSLESQIDQVIYFSQAGQLLEEHVLDPESGVKLNGNFIDYRVPTTLDVPVVDKEILETRSGNAAYGGAGISHNLANSHMIITAIHNATGVWVDPPATPDRMLKGLGKC